MLLREDLGRRHVRDLQRAALSLRRTRGDDRIRGRCGDKRFAAADVALEKSCHRSAFQEISGALRDGPLLRAGRWKGDGIEEGLRGRFRILDPERTLGIVGLAFDRARDLYREYFLERETFARGFRVPKRVGLVNVEERAS